MPMVAVLSLSPAPWSPAATENARGELVIDSSKVKNSELSTRAYQAIYTWAAHNDKKVVPDSQYLEDGCARAYLPPTRQY
jgi:hypothetical protein